MAARDDAPHYSTQDLVSIPLPLLLLSVLPLGIIAVASWLLDLRLSNTILVSSCRVFVQLSVLGAILNPIFTWGTEYWWVVALYLCFMVMLAAHEAFSRPKYFFKGMFPRILLSIFVSLSFVGSFAFSLVVRVDPPWNPRYLIPISGMLLGNCITGISLATSNMLSSMVEQSREVELYLSFGASGLESCSRLLREAIRMGLLPTLNMMAVIGLISIPGMMTGQLLGGAPVTDAARYQMLIVYLIATCAFIAILLIMWFVVNVSFDRRHMLRTDQFTKREKRVNIYGQIASGLYYLLCCLFNRDDERQDRSEAMSDSEVESLKKETRSTSSYSSHNGGGLELKALRPLDGNNVKLVLRGITCSVPKVGRNGSGAKSPRRILFRDVGIVLGPGQAAVVRGPSGIGKSMLLRIISGLSEMDKGDISLLGEHRDRFDPLLWRRRVRFVTQYKVDLPGTPQDFLYRVNSFRAFRSQSETETDALDSTFSRLVRLRSNQPVVAEKSRQMLAVARDLVECWGMSGDFLDREWKELSAGEAQRVLVALALATRPDVLLLDEATSALDIAAKLCVEKSVEEFSSKYGMNVLWITHDDDQVDRLTGTGGC